MKIAKIAMLAAYFFALAIPSVDARTMRHHNSHRLMKHGHHMHMMRGTGGKMPGHRTF